MRYNEYLATLFASILISIILAIFFWRRRPAPGATAMAGLSVSVLIWSLGYILEITATTLSGFQLANDVAYELHDDTAQYLSILKMQIGSLLRSGKIQSPEIVDKLQFLEKDADRAFQDVRRYSHELRPGILEHQGLLAALEQMAEDTNKLEQLRVEVNSEGDDPGLAEDVKLGFFRIAQEAVNNARKHAKSSLVEIKLLFIEKKVVMSVTDNGVGFDLSKAVVRTSEKGSMGLMSMQERANLIGAKLTINSKAGQGTTVTVELTL